MIEGALEADGRIAAKNATKIRAALMEMADYKKIFLQYQETQPISTKNKTQDNSRARAWAIMNVRLRTEALASTLWRTWAEAYVLGEAAADEWIKKTIQANKAADDGYIDWRNWQPGDRASALMLRRPGAFQRLLDQTNVTIKGMERTSLADIGNALANTIELGLDAERASILIGKHVASASRALTIAITEQNRAMSAATIQRYKDADLEKVEWQVSDPCPKCAQNSGVEVPIGTSFPSGNTQPPAHPHCRCVLLPVIPGMEEETGVPGAVTTPLPTGTAHITTNTPTPKEEIEAAIAAIHAPKTGYIPGQWRELSREEVKEFAIDRLKSRYSWINPRTVEDLIARDKPTQSLIKNGKIFQNGDNFIQFYLGGSSVAPKIKQEIIEHVDKLQSTNPNGKVTITIGPSKKGAYGWATLNGDQIWLAPKTAKMTSPNKAEGGDYKMPVLLDNAQFKYTLTHEWGHHIDKGSPLSGQDVTTTNAIQRIKQQFPDAFKSGYGQTKTEEFYAENFAEYFLSEGKTTNEITQAMAKEFGWKV